MQEIVTKLENTLKELDLFIEGFKNVDVASIPKMSQKEKAKIGLLQIKLYTLEGLYIFLYNFLKEKGYSDFTKDQTDRFNQLKESVFNLVSGSTGNIIFNEDVNKMING